MTTKYGKLYTLQQYIVNGIYYLIDVPSCDFFFFGMVRGKLEMRLNEKTFQNEKIKNLKIEIYF